MPVGAKYDFLLNNNGYILARPGQGLARAWQRSGVPDTPTVEQSRITSEYGGLPPQIEYPEVWNDWSGGFGYGYRHPPDENSYFGFLANPNTYHWAENFDARFSRQLVHCQKLKTLNLTGSISKVESMLDSISGAGIGNGKLFPGNYAVLLVGDGLISTAQPVTSGSFAINVILEPALDIAYQPAIFGSYVYLPVLQGTGFFQLAPALAFLLEESMPGRGFVNAGNRLWRWHGNQNYAFYAQSCAAGADPTVTSNWSATLSIGNQAGDITSAVTVEDQVFFGMQDGVFAGDASGTFVSVIPGLSNQRHSDNARDMCIYNGGIVVPAISGLYWYDPATGESLETSPSSRSNRSPIRGWPRAVRQYGPWLFTGVWTGSQSWIMAGQPSKTGQFANLIDVWHPLWRLPNVEKVNRIHFDGITSLTNGTPIPTRFWISTEATMEVAGTTDLYYVPIPRNMENPLNAENVFAGSANYTNSARMDFGITDGRAPSTFKVYRSCEVTADNLDGSQRWGLIYYTIDSGTRTLLGTVNTSPRSVLYFPNNQGSFVMGQAIEISLESYIAAGAEATTPVYRSVVLRQTQSPRSVDVITAVVDVGDNMVDRQGSPMRPGANQVNELRGLVATGPVPLLDLIGNTWQVKVLAPVEEQEQWQEGATNPSVLATIKMAVMSFTGS